MDKKKMQVNEQHKDAAGISGLDRKKKRIAGAVALAALAAAVWYLFWGKAFFAEEQENTVKVTASAGQEIQYARLTSVKGNEITYTLAQAMEAGEEGPGGDPSEFAAFGRATQRGGSDTFTYNGVTYRLTDQTFTVQIPVGTDVTTKLGTITTFSRLAAGDCVALVTEESGDVQIITAVYIIG